MQDISDKVWNTNEIVAFALKNDMQVVIASKRNRKKQRCYDKELYHKQHVM